MDELSREYHPAANIFPLMTGDDFAALKDDIAQNGQIEPIWLHPDGRIIDGRNRHRACIETGVTPIFRTWGGDGSLVSFVVSLNLHRRHLTASQRAAAALEVLPMLEDEARERQKELAGTRPNTGDLVEIFPQGELGRSRDIAAELFGTNGRYVSDASRIQREAPEMLEHIRAGEMSIPQAIQEIKNNAPHVARNSGNNEWYTPGDITALAREVMGGIDLDPASSEVANRSVGADVFYTEDDDGLSFAWHGRIWLNPPYSTGLIDKFCSKVVYHFSSGDIESGIVLVNNATETGWFQELCTVAAAIVFPKSRVRFLSPDGTRGAPLQGQAILYFGEAPDGFIYAFSAMGVPVWLHR